MRALVGVAAGGKARRAGARPLVGRSRGGAAVPGRPRRCDELQPPLPPDQARAAVRGPRRAGPGQHHVRIPGRLALCPLHARVLRQGHRRAHGGLGQVPGLRVHRHQRSLSMRQDRRKLHSARRPARPIR